MTNHSAKEIKHFKVVSKHQTTVSQLLFLEKNWENSQTMFHSQRFKGGRKICEQMLSKRYFRSFKDNLQRKLNERQLKLNDEFMKQGHFVQYFILALAQFCICSLACRGNKFLRNDPMGTVILLTSCNRCGSCKILSAAHHLL